MFAYLKGNLAFKNNENAVVDVGGVGYSLQIPFSTYRLLPDIDNEVKLYTYMAVREDNISLFGFFSNEEKRLFEQLISVSGIGPKSALSILASGSVSEITFAIESGNDAYLKKFPGIGAKASQQIILDLAGKMSYTASIKSAGSAAYSSKLTDVIDALVALGYTKKEATKVVEKLDPVGHIDETLYMSEKDYHEPSESDAGVHVAQKLVPFPELDVQ